MTVNTTSAPIPEINVIGVLAEKIYKAEAQTTKLITLRAWLLEQDIPEGVEHILRELVRASGWLVYE